jgi:hypothetical protein
MFDIAIERTMFEDSIWSYYQNLKLNGWSDPAEGDNKRGCLFWRDENGQYGVKSIEAAWSGWQMRARF